MKFIVLPRQAGKTHMLVEWVRKGVETRSYPFWSRVILTPNIREADRIRGEYQLDYTQVYSLDEWRTAHLGPRSVEIGVDNLDWVLRDLLGDVRVVTATGEY